MLMNISCYTDCWSLQWDQ